ncbi:ABC transporter substrate-binding protein [Ramlibacter sp.]|uniref:ABC transporter substrate-binding protein n=1 Tax=Ramlibacter sp. TaxID=1917967 RepID=UPI0035ADE9CB
MNRRLTHLALLGLLAAGVAAPAAAQQGVTDTEILIGDIVPMTGPPALLGVPHTIGVRLAIEEVNAAGGINGRKVRAIFEDDGYVPSRTIQGVRKLLTADKVFALTSMSGSAQGQAVLPLIKQSGIPVINSLSFSDDVHTPLVKNIFVMGTRHPLVTEQLSAALNARYPGRKWALVSQDDEYGEMTREGFEATEKAKKLDVALKTIYKKGQTDFSAEMLRVKNSGATALYAGGVLSENVAMVKELERLGMKDVPVGISYVAQVPAIVKLMGSAGANVYTMDYVVSLDSDKGKAFIEKAKKHLPEADVARIHRFALTGYAGARILFEAMRQCGKALTWECTISKLDQTKNFDTGVLNSPVSFSPTQHLSLPQLNLLKVNTTTMQFEQVK